MTIFEVHLKKLLSNTTVGKGIMGEGSIPHELLHKLAKMTEGFVGAEIEQVVICALYEAFFQSRDLLISDLEVVISNMVPLSVTQKEQIKALRDWANVRAVAATAKDALDDYSTQVVTDNDDISKSRGGRTIDF
jgi:hypothetical protein